MLKLVEQGGDSSTGTQALPVGKIIETKVCRKDNPKVSQICIGGRKFNVRKYKESRKVLVYFLHFFKIS